MGSDWSTRDAIDTGSVAGRTFHAQDLAQWHLRTAPLVMSLVRCLAVASPASSPLLFCTLRQYAYLPGKCLV